MFKLCNAFLVVCIQFIYILLYGQILFKAKDKNNIKKITVLFIGIISQVIFLLYLDGFVKTLGMLFTIMFVLKYIYNISLKQSIIASIVYIVFLTIPDILLILISTKILNISKEFCFSYMASNIFSTIFVNTLMIVLVYPAQKIIKKTINYNISSDKQIIYISFIIFIILIIYFYKLAYNYRININNLGDIMLIISIYIIFFYLCNQKIRIEASLKKYDELLYITKNYENDLEKQRIIMHETKNELLTIKSKIIDGCKNKEIISYINSILNEKNEVSSSSSKYSKMKYLPQNGLKGFLYYKIIEAEEKNIKTFLNISKDVEKSFLNKISDRDFKDSIRVIGIILDNAIDACENCEKKEIGIEIYNINEDINIIVTNIYKNYIDLENIGTKKFTTKGKNRGNGLMIVKHIVSKNSNLNVLREIKKDIFIQKIVIKKH